MFYNTQIGEQMVSAQQMRDRTLIAPRPGMMCLLNDDQVYFYDGARWCEVNPR